MSEMKKMCVNSLSQGLNVNLPKAGPKPLRPLGLKAERLPLDFDATKIRLWSSTAECSLKTLHLSPQQANTHQSKFNSYFRALQHGCLLGAQILTFYKFLALPIAMYPSYRWMD
ncbi:hypothetical protein ElyMa_001009500 [Elysia marginata]|uniref:Uncharacterized protein n=1 Tax=Elysia marginata TaxID=1093978 RepID=A0AAV4HL17_9GAST|nr:hypothetical protein ElyMa_001009500 [Elysia marginata]